MDEQDFRLLNVLGRTRNITHAADELYITQSSVSKRIRQMERELGTTLMLRSRQGIQFTPSGEIVLAHIQHILHELDQIRQELVETSGAIAGADKGPALRRRRQKALALCPGLLIGGKNIGF